MRVLAVLTLALGFCGFLLLILAGDEDSRLNTAAGGSVVASLLLGMALSVVVLA